LLTVLVVENNSLLRIEASNITTGKSYLRDVPGSKIFEETKYQVQKPSDLQKFIELAVKGVQSNLSASLHLNSDPQKSLEDAKTKPKPDSLVLRLSHQPPFSGSPIEFDLALEPLQISVDQRIDQLARLIEHRTHDKFSDSPGHINPGLMLSHNGRVVVKKKDAPQNQHSSATTGCSFQRGRHYIEVKLIRCANNHCMVGVQSHLGPLTPFPGHSIFPTGKSFYGHNGHIYSGGTNANYNMGGFGPGDYIGVLLDMDRKKVTFFINGQSGEELALEEESYHFIVNVYSNFDAVKILPRYCWHK